MTVLKSGSLNLEIRKDGNNMSRVNIFDLERRVDLQQEYAEMVSTFANNSISTRNMSSIRVDRLMDLVIKEWPYREAATTVNSYLAKKGIGGKALSDSDILCIFELWINLLHWAPVYDSNKDNEFSIAFYKLADTVQYIENIEYILEKLNFSIRKITNKKAFPQYVISKRDAHVNAAIEAVPELSETLLSYMDIRNKDSVDFKREALREIGFYFDNKKDVFKGTEYNGLYDTLTYALNNFGVRHNNEKQVPFSPSQRKTMYDKVFKLALFLMQVDEIKGIKDEINSYRP